MNFYYFILDFTGFQGIFMHFKVSKENSTCLMHVALE